MKAMEFTIILVVAAGFNYLFYGIFLMSDFIVFGSPLIGSDEINSVIDVLDSGWLGTGPKVNEFEEKFKAYKAASSAMAVNSCTSALHLSYLVSGISAGDEVITTPMTFCATVNAIIHAGGVPVLADIDPLTLNISPLEIEKKITSKTKAIVPVHFAGRPCNMNAIMSLANLNGLKVIEDCAHAVEAEYRGQKTGTIGDFGCFSFYSTKNIVTAEGGMVLARNKEDAARIKVLSLHGMNRDAWKRFGGDGYKHYQVTECGYKYNMIDLLAAIGISQLEKVEKFWARRREIWTRYMNELANLPIGLPATPELNTKHAFHLFTLQIDQNIAKISRDAFIDAMTAHGVGVGVHYLSIPEHQYYRDNYGWDPQDYPYALKVGRETVSIPISPKLSDTQIDKIIESIKKIFI